MMRSDEDHDIESKKPQQKIHGGSRNGYENVIPFGLTKIAWIHHNWLCPAKANKKQHNQPNRIDVCTRVQRQSAHQSRRKIPERYGSTRMRVLMKGHGNDEPRDAEQHLFKIKSEHILISHASAAQMLLCHHERNHRLRIDNLPRSDHRKCIGERH